jgi:hypothetical protein
MVRKIGRFSQRALPVPSCPSPAGFPADRSSCRPGVYPPEPPGSGSDEPPPAGTALAPPAGVTGKRPFTGARFGECVADLVTIVKEYHYFGDDCARRLRARFHVSANLLLPPVKKPPPRDSAKRVAA